MRILDDVLRRIAVAAVVLGMQFAVAGCLSEKLSDTTELPKEQAATVISAGLAHARIPLSFTPSAFTVITANWGGSARTFVGSFSTTKPELQSFLNSIGAAEQPNFLHAWINDGSKSCPHDNAATQTSDVLDSLAPFLQPWYDRGIFRRCFPVEAWALPHAAFLDPSRFRGYIFSQARAGDDESEQVNTVVAALYP